MKLRCLKVSPNKGFSNWFKVGKAYEEVGGTVRDEQGFYWKISSIPIKGKKINDYPELDITKYLFEEIKEMNDYKVGDVVRIKKNADGYDFYEEGMAEYRGRVATVTEVLDTTHRVTGKGRYRLRVNGSYIPYYWYDHMLEKYDGIPELMTGDFVELDDGKICMVLLGASTGDILREDIDCRSGVTWPLSDYDERIVRVYRATCRRAYCCFDRIKTKISEITKESDIQLIWEKHKEPEVTELTVAEVENILGYPVKIVKE